MMEQKFDQPTQVFELLLSPTFKLYLVNLINFSCVKAKTESVERRQSSVMIKFFMFRFSDMMEQRIENLNLGFWALDFTYFHLNLRIFKKVSRVQEKTESVESIR